MCEVDADVIDAAIAAVVAGDGEEELPPPENKQMNKKEQGEKRKRPELTDQADGKIFLRCNLCRAGHEFSWASLNTPHPSYDCSLLSFPLLCFVLLFFAVISSPLPQHISCLY